MIFRSFYDSFFFVTEPVKPSVGDEDEGRVIPVNERKSVINIGDNITSLTKSILRIACPATGTPPPDVRWFKDGKLLTKSPFGGVITLADGRLTVDFYNTLTFKNPNVTDSGYYMCVAENIAGAHNLSSDVKFVGKNCVK